MEQLKITVLLYKSLLKRTAYLASNNSTDEIGIGNTYSSSFEKNSTFIAVTIISNNNIIVKIIKYIDKKILGCPIELKIQLLYNLEKLLLLL